MFSYCSRPPQEAPRSPQERFKRLSWRFSRLPGPPKTAQDGQNPSEKCVSRVLALLDSVLKIFCFARSILIAPGLFQERPMTLPRGLKTAPGSSKNQDCPKILLRGFLSASAALQGRPRPSKTASKNFNEVFQQGFSRGFINKVFFPLSEPSCGPKRSPALLGRAPRGLGHRAFLVLSEAFFS